MVGIAASSLLAGLLPLAVSPAVNEAASISTGAVDPLLAILSVAPNSSVFSVLVVVVVAVDSVSTPVAVVVAADSISALLAGVVEVVPGFKVVGAALEVPLFVMLVAP